MGWGDCFWCCFLEENVSEMEVFSPLEEVAFYRASTFQYTFFGSYYTNVALNLVISLCTLTKMLQTINVFWILSFWIFCDRERERWPHFGFSLFKLYEKTCIPVVTHSHQRQWRPATASVDWSHVMTFLKAPFSSISHGHLMNYAAKLLFYQSPTRHSDGVTVVNYRWLHTSPTVWSPCCWQLSTVIITSVPIVQLPTRD